jgi:prevent-host-death family protein
MPSGRAGLLSASRHHRAHQAASENVRGTWHHVLMTVDKAIIVPLKRRHSAVIQSRLSRLDGDNVSVWQVQEAKQKFSQVLRKADDEPQWITRQGQRVGVLLSARDYEALAGPRVGLIEYLVAGPRGDDLLIERDQSTMRPVAWS